MWATAPAPGASGLGVAVDSRYLYMSLRNHTAGASHRKSFAPSKEHCRRPHVPSSWRYTVCCVFCLSRHVCRPRPIGLLGAKDWAGSSGAGRAVALQASGHRFDPDRLHQSSPSAKIGFFVECSSAAERIRVLGFSAA
ncbi:hypothetical protein COLO4_03781 [Corchorus olitorius]|uniref:Uncharacterized protein n=1 Tax=Corchorus olitorius TaxID=93759 RepID=A0A1R3KWN9_9ROSI|nr:hypothetical protein COLO4_03781 [Corchorus olitorius]